MDNNTMTLEEKKSCFDAFIEEYKENSLADKQKLIISDLKELIALFQHLCDVNGISSELLINREIADLNKENYTQDDFAEAVYVYLQIYKEIMSDFLNPIIGDDSEDNNEN